MDGAAWRAAAGNWLTSARKTTSALIRAALDSSRYLNREAFEMRHRKVLMYDLGGGATTWQSVEPKLGLDLTVFNIGAGGSCAILYMSSCESPLFSDSWVNFRQSGVGYGLFTSKSTLRKDRDRWGSYGGSSVGALSVGSVGFLSHPMSNLMHSSPLLGSPWTMGSIFKETKAGGGAGGRALRLAAREIRP